MTDRFRQRIILSEEGHLHEGTSLADVSGYPTDSGFSRLLRSWSKHGAPKLVQSFLFRLDF